MKLKKSLKGGACQSTGCTNKQRLIYSTQGDVGCSYAKNLGGQRLNYLLPNSQKGGNKSYNKKKNIKKNIKIDLSPKITGGKELYDAIDLLFK